MSIFDWIVFGVVVVIFFALASVDRRKHW